MSDDIADLLRVIALLDLDFVLTNNNFKQSIIFPVYNKYIKINATLF